MSGSQVCVYIYIHIYIYTHHCVYVYKQEPVLTTVGAMDMVTRDQGRMGCLQQAPPCIKNSLFTPKSPNPGRAAGRMKGCGDVHAETSRLPLSIPCHQHRTAGMCSGISGISSIHSGTAKGKKTFIINKLSSLTGYFEQS